MNFLWKSNQADEWELPLILQYAEVKTLSHEECVKRLAVPARKIIKPYTVCAVAKAGRPAGACPGDSGI